MIIIDRRTLKPVASGFITKIVKGEQGYVIYLDERYSVFFYQSELCRILEVKNEIPTDL